MQYKLFIDEENCDKYGIDVYEDEKVVRQVRNISDSKPDISKLVRLCNELKVELCHLDDVIENYLTDFKN